MSKSAIKQVVGSSTLTVLAGAIENLQNQSGIKGITPRANPIYLWFGDDVKTPAEMVAEGFPVGADVTFFYEPYNIGNVQIHAEADTIIHILT